MSSSWKEFAASEITHSVAHYLTTLHKLHEERGYARVSDVARELEVTKGSVSTQMKHLKEKGFVVEDDNRFLRLTAAGEAVAREVKHNRAILINFIQNVLGIGADQAETDACKIEHLLSRETSQHLLAMMQLLQSEHPAAQAFRETFKGYKMRCPTLEECNLCTEECLLDADCAHHSGPVMPAPHAGHSRPGSR